jgi:type II secretory ATPase GspE/PulE/Tfp pilus assembly ATPase PilB-like protein
VRICRVAEEFRHAEHQGYEGRTAVMELLKFDRDLDDFIARGVGVRELLAIATAKGFVPLADVAVGRVLRGITTLDEISRVVDLTDRVG